MTSLALCSQEGLLQRYSDERVAPVRDHVEALLEPEQARATCRVDALKFTLLLVSLPLASSQRKKQRTVTTISSDSKMNVTGPFGVRTRDARGEARATHIAQALDAELHLMIFELLDTRTKLIVTSEARRVALCVSLCKLVSRLFRLYPQVCKGWRSLRNTPELWRRVELCAPGHSWSRSGNAATGFSDKGVTEFLSGSARSPLRPNAAAVVRELTLKGGKEFAAATLKNALKLTPGATSITLSAKKITNDTLSFLAKPREGVRAHPPPLSPVFSLSALFCVFCVVQHLTLAGHHAPRAGRDEQQSDARQCVARSLSGASNRFMRPRCSLSFYSRVCNGPQSCCESCPRWPQHSPTWRSICRRASNTTFSFSTQSFRFTSSHPP